MTRRLGLLALLVVGSSCAADAETVESTRWAMGTTLRVVLVDGVPVDAEPAALLDRIFEPAMHWERLLSTYREDSVVSALHAAAGDTLTVPIELLRYFERARRDFRRTGGVFDILYRSSPPGEAAWDALHWGESRAGAWMSAGPGVRIDAGGDGKGVAVDALVERLREEGIERALVDFGGSSWYALGSPSHADRWTVEVVDHAGDGRGEVHWSDAALSISQTFLRSADGPARAHIVDPTAGEIVRRPRTVIVLAPTATAAEVLSTALLIRPDLELLDRYEGSSAVILEENRVLRSPGATWYRSAR